MNWLLVFIGGGLGSIIRYSVSTITQKTVAGYFPYATFFSNVASSFILGLMVGWFTSRSMNQKSYRLFFAVGFCGGFSTFSAFTLETYEMLRLGNYVFALLNITFSIVMCLVVLWAGIMLYQKIN